MLTPTALDHLFAAWLRSWERGQPTDGDLAAFIAALPIPAQRRAARVFVRGFVAGCDYCTTSERERADTDLAAVAGRLATTLDFIAELRAQRSPESTTSDSGTGPAQAGQP